MRQGRRNSVIANIDWLTIIIYAVLVFLGWINIYSAVYDDTHQSILDTSCQYGKQLIWIAAAVLVIIVVLLIDSKFYSTFAYVLYAFGCLLLLLVLILGKEVNGAKSWIEIGSFSFQPVEFTKIAVCLAMARIMSSENFSFKYAKNYLYVGIILAIPMLMILLQNDTGSTLVFCTFIFVMFREGMSSVLFVSAFALIFLFILALIVNIPLLMMIVALICLVGLMLTVGRNRYTRIILYSGIVISAIFTTLCLISPELMETAINFAIIGYATMAVLMLIVLMISKLKPIFIAMILMIGMGGFVYSVDYIFDNVLQEHQKSRILDLLGENEDVLGTGYNVHQSKIAIGSGGFTGKSFLHGTQTKYNFVPEQSTDFIFCTIGEEWGFLGCTVVILLYAFLIFRIISDAERSREAFTRIYGYCVAACIFMHLFINVGMTIGLMPIIGIPLPLLSYGGSSLWAFTILIFIFIALDHQERKYF
ncbi:MAG: rod shape-determining protein RodA [Bacteroidales bacterium]|nr:rod shape-determining protein RodA [Bacteroidales bacterium]